MKRSLTLTAAFVAASFATSAIAQPAAPEAPAEVTAPPAAPPEAPPAPAPSSAPVAPAPTPAPEADAKPAAPPTTQVVAPERVTLAETPEATPTPTNPPQPQAKPAPPPAPADAGTRRDEGPVSSRFNIGFNLDSVLYKNRSFDLFSSNDVSQLGGISIGYAVVDGVISLVPELGFSIGSDSGSSSFGGAIESTELDTRKYYGGFSLRWAALSFLEPEARIAVGAAVSKIAVTPDLGATELDQKDVSPFGSVGAGFTIHTPGGALETRTGSLRSLMIGLTLEGGYVAEAALTVKPTPSHEDGRIPTEDATLGTLDRRGPYARAALVLRF